MKSSLIIYMEGALQGWGTENSTMYFRSAAQYPKRKSIIGLISAALGYSYEDPRIKELENKLRVRVKYSNSNKGDLVEDFCTAFGDKNFVESYAYFKGRKEKNKLIEKADGSKVKDPIVMKKQYRADAYYFIELSSEDEELINEIREAFDHPVYPLYLGRKCCVGMIYVLDKDMSIEEFQQVLKDHFDNVFSKWRRF